MTGGAYLAFLRAVNVAGRKLAMSDLRRLADDLDLREARTYLQSGNLIFRSARGSPAELEALLEQGARRAFGASTDFLVRTAQEWGEAVRDNPFVAEAASDPAHLLVIPLKGPAEAASVRRLQDSVEGREQVRAGARLLYAYYPDGIGRSRLTLPRIEKAMGSRGTARNWNTTTALLGLAGTPAP